MAMLDDATFKGEILGLLKDMASYFEKQDAIQERAKLDKPPKAQETQKNIVGGQSGGFAPAKGITKQYVPIDESNTSVGQDPEQNLASDSPGESLLKEGEEEPEEVPEDGEEVPEEEEEPVEEEEEESDEELKSILKDIRSALSKSVTKEDVGSLIKSEIKKAMPNAMDALLRKQGFHVVNPDVRKLDSGGLGFDQITDIKKSEDKESKDIGMVAKGVEDMSKLSWQQLGVLGEKQGLFKPFKT